MSALWCEPFDEYPDTAHMLNGTWAQVDGTWELSGINPRTGSTALRFKQTSLGYARRIFGGPKVAAGIEYAVCFQALPVREDLLVAVYLAGFLTAGGLGQVLFVLGTDGAIVAYSSFNFANPGLGPATLLARSNPCIVTGGYMQVGFKVGAVDAVHGTLEVRVNGVTVLNLAGVNTDPQSAAEISQFCIYADGTGMMAPFDVDDMHAWDTVSGQGPTDFVGNAAAIYRPPSADTAIADWTITPAAATAYPWLKDNLDTTYIASPTAGQRSAFSFAALPSDTEGVIYQQLNFRAVKSDAGDCDLQPGFISSAVESDGPSVPISQAETWFWWIDAEDPATSGAPWSVASANAVEGVFERTL